MTKKAKTYKNFEPGLTINKEYSDLLPPMSLIDYDQLKSNIKKDGIIREPLTICDGVLIDGNNRYKIAEHLDMKYTTKTKKFKDVSEIRFWIIMNQLGKRKMTRDQLAVMALNLVPYYTAKGKLLQSEGGKTKQVTGKKGMRASVASAKKVGVAVQLVKDIINVNTNSPELLNFIKTSVMTVDEAYKLKERIKKDVLLIVKDELSTEAEELLREIRLEAKGYDPELEQLVVEEVITVTQAKEMEKIRPKETAFVSAEGGLTYAGNETLTEVKKAAETGGSKTTKKTTKKSTKSPGTKGSMDAYANMKTPSKLYRGFRAAGKEAFGKDNFSLITPEFKSPEPLVTEVINDFKEETTDKKYSKNTVVSAPLTPKEGWFQEAMKSSTLTCLSKHENLCLFYFGKERNLFVEAFSDFGFIMHVIRTKEQIVANGV